MPSPPNPNPHSHSALARRPLDYHPPPSRCTPQTLIPSPTSSLHLSPQAGGRHLPLTLSCTPSRPPLPDLRDPSDQALSPSPPIDLEILAACLRRRLLPDLGDPGVRALCPGICHRFFSVSLFLLCFSVSQFGTLLPSLVSSSLLWCRALSPCKQVPTSQTLSGDLPPLVSSLNLCFPLVSSLFLRSSQFGFGAIATAHFISDSPAPSSVSVQASSLTLDLLGLVINLTLTLVLSVYVCRLLVCS